MVQNSNVSVKFDDKMFATLDDFEFAFESGLETPKKTKQKPADDISPAGWLF
jgi:hypothetical protein